MSETTFKVSDSDLEEAIKLASGVRTNFKLFSLSNFLKFQFEVLI